jgi:transposase-like protein
MKKSRRTFTAEFKAKIAIEVIKEIKTISELAQIYEVNPNLITHWKKEFIANAGKVFDIGKDGFSEVKKLKEENEELFHQIGQLSVDINWLKKKFYNTSGYTQ